VANLEKAGLRAGFFMFLAQLARRLLVIPA
jgi:hypothetical protein